jgi:uncharacterized protein (AIM24 family)
MPIPALLTNAARTESYGGVTYSIEGELVPVLHMALGNVPVYFEHHILLWKDPHIQIELKPLKGTFKRVLSGMPVFMTMAKGPGRIAFSRDGVGQVFAMHLKAGEGIDVREHQFLAATDVVDFSFTRLKGAANMLFGGTGIFIDTFSCARQEGILWLHGYGNVFEVSLMPGEQIDVEPGGWVYKDRAVQMQTIYQRLTIGFLAGAGQIFWNRFTGPGRVGLQSMYLHMPTEE